MISRTEPATFTLCRACWQQDQPALSQVRVRVFVQEQGVPLELEWDPFDAQAVHLLARNLDGQPIGTARILPNGQIGRMAVLAPWRGRGVGTALLREALTIATAPGLPRPFLNAQSSAVNFYRRHGFHPEGDEFLEAGITHQRMRFGPAP